MRKTTHSVAAPSTRWSWAFRRDFERNGPSLYRMCQTIFQGWQRYKNYPDPRVRERFARQTKKLASAYNAALWVMEREFKKVNRSVSERIHDLRQRVVKEFSITARQEEKRLASGCTYEPTTFIDRRNWAW